jgi:hypothetical protein
MHHTKEGERTCKMRASCTGSDASILALAGGLGVMPPPTPAVSAFEVGDVPRRAPRPAILRSDRPESPPPRA